MKLDKSKQSNCGITLIELLVVVVIIGIIAAIAIPQMGQFIDSARLKSGVQQLSSEFAAARVTADRTSRTTHLIVNSTGATWAMSISHNNSCNPTTNAAACTIGGAASRIHNSTAFPGVSIEPVGVTSIAFNYPRGTANPTTTFTLSSPAGRSAQLNVNLVGRVSVCSQGGWGGYPAC